MFIKKVFALSVFSSVILSANAQTMQDMSDGAKRFFNNNPAKVSKAIELTTPTIWGQCLTVGLSSLAMEIRGHKWDTNTAATWALLLEAMYRVRANYLARGQSEATLDQLLKSYSGRQVGVAEMRFCNEHINKITD